MKTCRLTQLLLLALVLYSAGCIGRAFQPYEPLPQWEAGFYKDAKKDVFPADVRSGGRKDTLVAWAGIVKEIRYESEAELQVARLVIEHRYFSWSEKRTASAPLYVMSSRGEGLFAAAWQIDRELDRAFVKRVSPGDMVIVYGYPSIIRSGLINLFPTKNIRDIKPADFRADVVDYGRPGEPVRMLAPGTSAGETGAAVSQPGGPPADAGLHQGTMQQPPHIQ